MFRLPGHSSFTGCFLIIGKLFKSHQINHECVLKIILETRSREYFERQFYKLAIQVPSEIFYLRISEGT